MTVRSPGTSHEPLTIRAIQTYTTVGSQYPRQTEKNIICGGDIIINISRYCVLITLLHNKLI